MQRFITIVIIPCMLLLTALGLPGRANAEDAQRRVPVVGLYLQPNLSVILPGYETITAIYDQAHPTGTAGVSFHINERFSLALELEGHGWTGRYAPPDGYAFDMRFLNYWLHLRSRGFYWQRGRWALGADAVLGMLFSREDGERFEADGQGVAVGAGPSVQMALGRSVAMSLNVMIEGAWCWYEVRSPQSSEAANTYSLAWPRVLIGLAIHGFVVQRTIRATRPPAAMPEPEPVSMQAPPESEISPDTPSPFDE